MPTVELTPFTKAQWLDNSGLPLAGGMLFTFAAGTSTPAATFTDSTGSTPNPNPVVLDAAGRADVWLNAGTAYKLIMQNSLGVQQWSEDGINPGATPAVLGITNVAGNFSLTQPTAATGGANQSSFSESIQAQYWNGAASATDQWTLQDVLGTGANPTSTFTVAHSGSSGTASVNLPSVALTGVASLSTSGITVSGTATLATANVKILENVRLADQFAGADWAAKVNAADADLGATKGEIWVNQNAGTSATTAITLSDDHTLKFIQEGTYATTLPITLGNRSAIIAENIGSTLINYTGNAYAIEINTVTQPIVKIGIQLATTALGAIRLRNSGNTVETRAKGEIYITATAWTSGQIGMLLLATTSTSAVYHNKFEIYANNVDFPVRFQSSVNTQGPNGNRIYLESNGHTAAFDVMDGTDNILEGMILGCHGLTGGTAFRLGATGNGGYGVSNCMFGPFSSEQGGTSTTINVASAAGLTVGCGNSVAIGQSNDSSGITDANAVSTLGWLQNGGALWHTIIGDNILPFGGARSALSAALKRNGTGLEARLGDDSLYTNFTARRLVCKSSALVVGDVSGITNFGTTATCSAVSGTDGSGTISIASSGTGQAANGSFTLTFHDGTWTAAPVCVVSRGDGNGPNTASAAVTTNATTATFFFLGLPVAGTTYTFNFVCIGK